MRARTPDASGTVRAGPVDIHWERFGSGAPAILLFGADTIVDLHMWKGQIGWLSRRHTVLTFDPPGNGWSGRTTDPDAYTDGTLIAAALAILDAVGVNRVVSVGVCSGAGVSLLLAAEHPDRVAGVVAINPGLLLSPRHPHRIPGDFDVARPDDDGWNKENRHYWLRDWSGFATFFFDQLLPEPHSTKQHDDAVGWACGTTPELMLADHGSVATSRRFDVDGAADVCRDIRCPVLAIVGDRDMCQPPERGRRVAELTAGDLVELHGSGHLPHARDPVRVNLEIAAFVRRLG